MSADILSYLAEVDINTVKKIFAFIRRRDLNVQFKIPDQEKIATARFLATESSNKINLVFKKDFEPSEKDELTFKIQIATDIYFFKAKVIEEVGRYFVIGPFRIFKLMRRKNTRFEIPVTWSQNSYILSPQKRTLNSKVEVLEISTSGARISVYPQLPKYEKKQHIQISLRFQKRAAFTIDAVIKHAKYQKLGGPILGVEFIFENALLQNKIQNICDDLAYALAQNLAVKL